MIIEENKCKNISLLDILWVYFVYLLDWKSEESFWNFTNSLFAYITQLNGSYAIGLVPLGVQSGITRQASFGLDS